MALVMGLGVSLVLTIAGVSVANYTVVNMHAANRSRATQGAAALAEAGLNNALAVLDNGANNPSDPNLLPPRTTPYDGGTVTWSGSFDSATGTWTLVATGRLWESGIGQVVWFGLLALSVFAVIHVWRESRHYSI